MNTLVAYKFNRGRVTPKILTALVTGERKWVAEGCSYMQVIRVPFTEFFLYPLNSVQYVHLSLIKCYISHILYISQNNNFLKPLPFHNTALRVEP